MTAGPDPAALRPRLRGDVVVGPALMRSDKPIHLIKDPVSGKLMTVGAKEHFIISRLDGRHSVADITAEYGAEFGRRLDERAWGTVMATLAGRRLLEEGPRPEPGPADASGTRRPRPTPLRAELRLVRPGPWLDRLHGWSAGWAFSRAFVVAAVAVAALTCLVVALNLGPLVTAMAGLREQPWLGAVVLALLWGVVALHELGHGLAAVHHGARVGAFGISWRFPMLAPYCAVEEIQLLPSPARVRIAFAGVFVSLLSLPPALLLWLAVPEGGTAHTFASALLLCGTVAALLNFVPFLRLDGYSMLNHALGTEDLARDARSYAVARLRARLRGSARPPEPPPRFRTAYRAYATSAFLFYAVLTALFAVWWFVLLQHLFGAWTAAGGLTLTALAITAAFRARAVRARRRDDRRPTPTDGKET